MRFAGQPPTLMAAHGASASSKSNGNAIAINTTIMLSPRGHDQRAVADASPACPRQRKDQHSSLVVPNDEPSSDN